jgi:ABC-type glycerol-3-phosphate transport system permease component
VYAGCAAITPTRAFGATSPLEGEVGRASHDRPVVNPHLHRACDLILGIIVVAFPIYYTFVASTHSLQTILRPPLPLLPGPEFFNNYSEALFGGVGRIGGVPVSTLLFNTTVVALGIAIGKIIISVLSAYAIVFSAFRSACSSSG